MQDGTSGPLTGIRVIDLTIWMSGPIGSMLLGDLGAEVIKVEGPTGDPTRRYVPIGTTSSWDSAQGVNFAYAQCNRNKRQVSLNLKSEDDRSRLYDLVRTADVFITNMQPDTLVSLGADEESIKSVNPEIIYAQAHGLGHTGPRAGDRCQDMLGMAYSGMLFTASPEPDEPFAPPGAMNDVLTGTMTALGILAALLQHRQDGQSLSVHSSLLHSAMWTQLVQIGTFANAPELVLPAKSRRSPRSPGVNQYKCADGKWIGVAAVTADAWARFAKAISADQRPSETLVDLPYTEVLQDAGEVRACLDELFARKSASYWLGLLQAAGIWCTIVNTIADLLNDEQVAANGYLTTLDDGLKTVSMPFMLSGYNAPTNGGRPHGADNDELLPPEPSGLFRLNGQTHPTS
jgi:crotonobetainyl-CoA:carnitine CoA-transferase CaiB-like acyl-CoA transferase